MTKFNPIDKIAWIYIKNKKILCTRSKGKDAWYIPGGKREAGESDMQALVREVKEELTVDIIENSVKYVGTFSAQAHGKPEGVIVKMTCYSADYSGNITPASEIEIVEWLDSSVDWKTLSPVDRIIFSHLKDKNLID